VKLELGKQIEVTRGTQVPMFGGKPMTIGDLLLQVIPQCAVNNERAVRLWRIAMDIDKAGPEAIDMPKEDYDLLKTVVLRGDRPTWVMANLSMAFDE